MDSMILNNELIYHVRQQMVSREWDVCLLCGLNIYAAFVLDLVYIASCCLVWSNPNAV